MSVKENIQFFHRFNPNTYLEILKNERGAIAHPSEPNAYIVEETPFYRPREIDEHISVVGFNYIPLSPVLVQALAEHPELVPDEVIICWLVEQDLFWKGTMGKVRKTLAAKKTNS